MVKGSTRTVLAAVIGFLILVALSIAFSQLTSHLAADQCEVISDLNTRRGDADEPVISGRGSTVVLGDSYAQGVGVPDPLRQSWPYVYGAASGRGVWVDAVGGTGFTNGGFCGDEQLATRTDSALRRAPDLVIVQAGLNDAFASPEGLRDAANRLLIELRGVPRVVVVGPAGPPALRAESVGSVDAILRGAARSAGREYVSTLGWSLPWQSDRIHPTPFGHVEYAERLRATIDGGR